MSLNVLTYNIRKGKGASGRRPRNVGALGRALGGKRLDLVLCQEVFRSQCETSCQARDLSLALGLKSYYGPNKYRRVGHHGNAIFTRWPANQVRNYDVSMNRVERRGVLYVKLDVGGQALHVFNVHLSLSHRQRLAQVRRLEGIMADSVGSKDPVLLAGDFNDWRGQLEPAITEELGFSNAFGHLDREEVLTWHARRPVFNLDRVYLRNLTARRAARLSGRPWRSLSDHFPLEVEISMGRSSA